MPNPIRHAYVVIALSLVGPLAIAAANVTESARMLPADTAVMLSVESVEGLTAAFKKTAYYELYKDPAMQDFVAPAEKTIRERIDKALKDLWRQQKIENPPETLPWPQGRVVVALFVSTIKVPTKDEGEEEESEGPDTRRLRKNPTQRIPDFQIVALADMGKAIEQAKTLAQQWSRSSSDSDTAKRRQRIRGIEFQIYSTDKAKSDVNDVFCLGFKDNWLIVGSSVPCIESVIRYMDRSADNGLAAQRGFQTAVRGVGEGELFLYVNADPIRRMIRDTETDKTQFDRYLQVLGLDNVTALSMAWQIAGNKQENARLKALLGVNGQRKGIPALVCPASIPIQPNDRLLSRDAILCVVAHYDLAKVYDQIARMVMEATAVDINFFVQTALAGTGRPDGQPPLNLRNDLLSQASSPQILTWRMDKPYTDPKNSRTLAGLAVRNAEKLDTALARIHQAYIAKSQPDLQRKMLEHTLYLLPAMPMMSPFLAQMGEAHLEPKQFAFAVAGGHLAFGEADVVEQVIRDSQKESSETLSSDPMFRHIRRSLSSEAGVYWYQNTQRYWEVLWTVLKAQARTAGNKGEDRPHSSEAKAEDGDLGEGISDPLKELRRVVDLNKLPAFDSIKKYLGASAGYTKEHADWIYLETVDVRPSE